MTLPLVGPEAEEEIRAVARWYNRQRHGLGREFLVEVRRMLVAIGQEPDRFPIVHRALRRVLLHRFPYALLFVELESELHVVACSHQRQDPQRWMNRR